MQSRRNVDLNPPSFSVARMTNPHVTRTVPGVSPAIRQLLPKQQLGSHRCRLKVLVPECRPVFTNEFAAPF
jgi:hypothetical protein